MIIMEEWICSECGRRLLPPRPGHEYGKKRKIGISLTLEMLSLLGITLVSLSVIISVFITYNITNNINGNITSRIGELQQDIEQFTASINGNVSTQIDKLQQNVSAKSDCSISSILQTSINVKFSCVDSTTNAVLSDCLLRIRILEQSQV